MKQLRRIGISFIVVFCLLTGALKEATPVIVQAKTTASAGASAVVNQKTDFRFNTIPKFKKSRPYVVVNGNKPYFKKEMLQAKNFEIYSAQDSLGRCGAAAACLDEKNMPDKKRSSISSIKPTGWHTYRYKGISGGYLYNRCHLIGYQLSAENANACNLITGTRYFNMQAMLPFENMVADYIEETGNHVLYRVTPIFKGKELVARGVLMEGISIEDQGKGIQYNVYCYNNQPGIKINYAMGTSSGNGSTSTSTSSTAKSVRSSKGKETSTTKVAVYVYSAKATKFHVKGCRYVKQISAANLRQETCRKKLIQAGYEPCKVCHP